VERPCLRRKPAAPLLFHQAQRDSSALRPLTLCVKRFEAVWFDKAVAASPVLESNLLALPASNNHGPMPCPPAADPQGSLGLYDPDGRTLKNDAGPHSPHLRNPKPWKTRSRKPRFINNGVMELGIAWNFACGFPESEAG